MKVTHFSAAKYLFAYLALKNDRSLFFRVIVANRSSDGPPPRNGDPRKIKQILNLMRFLFDSKLKLTIIKSMSKYNFRIKIQFLLH